MLIGQPFAVVATSLVAILVARELSTGDWARFSAFLGLAFGFGVLVDIGLSTWLLRELSRIAARPADHAAGRAGELLGAALTFSAAATVVLAAGSVATAAILGSSTDAVVTLGLFVGYIGTLATAGACEAQLRAHRRIGWVAAATLIEKALLLAGVVVVIVLTDATAASLAGVYLLAGIVRLGLAAALALPRSRLSSPTPSGIRHVVRSSAPFAASAAALNVIPRLDAFVLLTLSTTSAAYVALGDRILGPALFVPVILSITLYPFVATTHGARVGWRLVGIVATLGAVVAAVGIALAPLVVPLVFGDKYRPAILTVQVLLASLPFIYASNVLLTYLYSAGRERRVLGATLAAAVVGTGAVLVGQLTGGAELAAGGIVLRQALFTGVLTFIGLTVSQASGEAQPAASR